MKPTAAEESAPPSTCRPEQLPEGRKAWDKEKWVRADVVQSPTASSAQMHIAWRLGPTEPWRKGHPGVRRRDQHKLRVRGKLERGDDGTWLIELKLGPWFSKVWLRFRLSKAPQEPWWAVASGRLVRDYGPPWDMNLYGVNARVAFDPSALADGSPVFIRYALRGKTWISRGREADLAVCGHAHVSLAPPVGSAK